MKRHRASGDANTWRVELVYATSTHQELIEVFISPGATIEEVILHSGILNLFPEIDLSRQAVGIFGQVLSLQEPVHDRDRVEIYRPLIADPKEARRQRAAKKPKRRGKK
ncbi:MAG: RnfH family protein [Gammaproteobacteria bacterium]|nr:RnfH family protein [Gammaproteobacteria bacterium]